MASAAHLHGNNVGRGFAGGNTTVMTIGTTQSHGAVIHIQRRPTNPCGVAGAALLSSRNMSGCFASGAGAVVAAGAVTANACVAEGCWCPRCCLMTECTIL